MVRDERTQEEGQQAGGSGRGAEGRRREARPAWAEAHHTPHHALVTSCFAHLHPIPCLLVGRGHPSPTPNPYLELTLLYALPGK